MPTRATLATLSVGALASVAAVGGLTSAAHAATTRNVSPSGHDAGTCTSSPCKTITYALSQANAGDTIKAAPGSYHETVDIEKAVNLIGSGAGKTVINGSGLDPSANNVYGVVYVGNAGGAVTVQGFTIANPAPYDYTGGEPEVVALHDGNASDTVTITGNLVAEGKADTNASTEFPIGIDTFQNNATTHITRNVVAGVFQGVLAEDNGPLTVSQNWFTHLISGTQSGTTYPAEGVFVLSDAAGAVTQQNVTQNTFKNYGGYGVTWNAGYDTGNCTDTPCDGSISGSIIGNQFALSQSPSPAAAIRLAAFNNGNAITATVQNNSGYVTHPDVAISEDAENGGALHITASGNNITVQ